MASVKVKGLDNVIAKSRNLFNDIKTSRVLQDQIIEYVVNRIVAETRAGKSIPNNSKFSKLSGETIAMREMAKDVGLVDSQFFMSPEFPNNTLTGQLLKNVVGEIVKDVIEIKVKDTPRMEDPSITNADVAENLNVLGREFIGVNDKMRDRIRRLVLDEFRRRLKK